MRSKQQSTKDLVLMLMEYALKNVPKAQALQKRETLDEH